MSDERPIGVLVGGSAALGVVALLRTALPKEDLLVVSDDSYEPYAALPGLTVRRRLARLADELAGDGVKAVLLASLQGAIDGVPALPVPVVTLDGALEAAARASANGVVAAVCGEACTRGGSYERRVRKLRGGTRVVVQEWAGLREGRIAAAAVLARAEEAGAGAIALVCCHGSPLAPGLGRSALPVVDAATLAAARLRRLLVVGDALAQRRRPGRTIVSSSAPARAQSGLAAAVTAGGRTGRLPRRGSAVGT